jgi:hypothetical protein
MDFHARQQVLFMEALQNGPMIDIMIVTDLILVKNIFQSNQNLRIKLEHVNCVLF